MYNSSSSSSHSRTLSVLVEKRTDKIDLEFYFRSLRTVDLNKAFKVIQHIPLYLSHGLRVRLLHNTEAIGIFVLKPNLCAQKKLVQPFSLPRPSVWEWVFSSNLFKIFPSKIFRQFSSFFFFCILHILNISLLILT